MPTPSPSPSFDPWQEWFGIPPAEQPADHYRLLGLAPLESDRDRIARAADERMTLARTYQTGQRSDVSQVVLNKLAAARNCLLNPGAKAAYDTVLQAQSAAGTAKSVKRQARAVSPREELASPPADLSFDVEPLASQAEAPAYRRRQARGPRPIMIATIGLSLVTVAAAAWTFRSSWWPDSSNDSANTNTKPAEPAKPKPPKPTGGRTAALDPSKIIHLAPDAATIDAPLRQPGGLDMTVRDARVEASWKFTVRKAGFYMVEVTYATEGDTEQVFEVELDTPAKFSAAIRKSGGESTFVTDELKMVVFQRTGEYKLTLRTAGGRDSRRTIRVKEVTLRPSYLPKGKKERIGS